MLKGLGDLGKLGAVLKQAMEMKQRIEELRARLAQETMEGSAGGGAVRVVVNGALEIQSLVIDPELCNPDDLPLLQEMIIGAVNDAVRKMQAYIKERMTEIAGVADIPGLV